MKTMVKEWSRFLTDGLYQFVAETRNGDYIGTSLDVTDGKARRVWERIKADTPELDNYPDFCRAYREAAAEYNAYCRRDERRYWNFWRR